MSKRQLDPGRQGLSWRDFTRRVEFGFPVRGSLGIVVERNRRIALQGDLYRLNHG